MALEFKDQYRVSKYQQKFLESDWERSLDIVGYSSDIRQNIAWKVWRLFLPPPHLTPWDKWRSICPNDGAGGGENEFKLSFSGTSIHCNTDQNWQCVGAEILPFYKNNVIFINCKLTVINSRYQFEALPFKNRRLKLVFILVGIHLDTLKSNYFFFDLDAVKEKRYAFVVVVFWQSAWQIYLRKSPVW